VEELNHNLLSISQLCDKGYKITFEPAQCLMTDSKSAETVLKGKRVSNIYMFHVSCITSSMNCLLTRDDESWLWHRRLAHIHMHHLNKIAKVVQNEKNSSIVSIKSDHDREFQNEKFNKYAVSWESSTTSQHQELHSRMEL